MLPSSLPARLLSAAAPVRDLQKHLAKTAADALAGGRSWGVPSSQQAWWLLPYFKVEQMNSFVVLGGVNKTWREAIADPDFRLLDKIAGFLDGVWEEGGAPSAQRTVGQQMQAIFDSAAAPV